MKTHNAPRVVSFGYDTLRLTLFQFVDKATKARDWVAPLGVLATIVVTVVVSDFQDRFGISASAWRAVVVMTAVVTTVWLAVALVNWFRAPTVEDLLAQLIDRSSARVERRLIFVFRLRGKDGLTRVLVYRDIVWECFLFPHMKLTDDEVAQWNAHRAEQYVGDLFGLAASAINLAHVEDGDLHSQKYSEFTKAETTYLFRFALVSIDPAAIGRMSKRSFAIGGQQYRWMTLDEIEHDQNSARRNLDVLRHLRDYHQLFLRDPTPHA